MNMYDPHGLWAVGSDGPDPLDREMQPCRGPVDSGMIFALANNAGLGELPCVIGEPVGPRRIAESNGPKCPLVALTGSYNAAGGVVALFAPDLAGKLDQALAILNSQGITPTITDGFRTRADQQARWDKYQAALAAGMPRCGTVDPGIPCTFPAAQAGTGIHEIGDGVDFGANSNGANWATIRDVLNGINGLHWGASFSDSIHWETAHTPSQSQIANCEREHP